jgi:sterol desaturase/sphingolipid hydroxylase (fatty acid hydroxylase superfamily)
VALAVVQASAIALFLALGLRWPRQSGPFFHADQRVNVGTGLVLFILRVTVVAWVAEHVEVGLVDLGGLPPGVAFVLCFVALDFLRYAIHVADHKVPFLWSFHRVHHSSVRLDATSGLRMHAVDFLQLSLLPLGLFSVLLDTSGLPTWVVPAVLGVGAVSDGYQHANIRVDPRHPFRRVWSLVLNDPLFHGWHHVKDRALANGNYGQTLVIWDRLFGTAVDRPEPPDAFGLAPEDELERTIAGLQVLQPRRAPALEAALDET